MGSPQKLAFESISPDEETREFILVLVFDKIPRENKRISLNPRPMPKVPELCSSFSEPEWSLQAKFIRENFFDSEQEAHDQIWELLDLLRLDDIHDTKLFQFRGRYVLNWTFKTNSSKHSYSVSARFPFPSNRPSLPVYGL